ncbi:metal-dependent hydrolase [Candidatus Woesearchaeota archaeon]|nr:metal-dependent hydrolase [Candidatus Woesearchaeota archaeon]
MMFLTHLAGGIFAAVYFGNFLGISYSSNEKIITIVVAAVFALLPDIDMVKSKLGRKLQPFSNVLAVLFRHRGFLHSFIFAALVYFAMLYLFSTVIAAAAVLGYSSHLLLDMATKEGIMPLSPLSKMKIRGFVRTGGILEKAATAALFVLIILKLV